MRINQQGKDLLFSKLTYRQMQVVDAFLETSKNKAIGERLSILDTAVKAHFTKIYKRLNVKGRTDLIKLLAEYVEQK